MDELAQAVLNSLTAGSLYALAAVGLTLVYGVLRLTNFAHGDMLTLGAYVGYAINVQWNLPLALAFVAAPVVVAAFAVGTEYVVWRPLRRAGAGLLQKLLMAIGLALFLRYAIQFVWGGDRDFYEIDNTATIAWVRDAFDLTLGFYDLLTIVISLVVLVGVALLLARTLLGTSMRALSDDVDLAESSGVDTDRTVVWTWALSGALVGLAGVLAGATINVYPTLGWDLLLTIFACVIVGGIGSAYGALLGSYVIAFSQEFLVLVVDDQRYKTTIGFVIMVLVLLVRPQGILGSKRAVN
ncbi:MAG: inner-rane translocator [Thermoleophilia bacterium]|nr:inner-rane translocator [Thermoleophilia bacterium]